METPEFKPLSEQVADRMVTALKGGFSLFQKPLKPDGTASFLTPYNPTNGYDYTGSTALILAMKNKQDPRWMNPDQARYNRTMVIAGSRGTLTNYLKKKEYVPVLDSQGVPQKKADGTPKTEPKKLEVPVLADEWLFNADQLKNMPDMKEAIENRSSLQTEPLAERVEKIIKNSGASFDWAMDAKFYDQVNDKIIIPDKSEFANETQYFATTLHELAHWSGHPDRLNLDFGADLGTDAHAKEELRTNIASLFIAAELNIANDIGNHAEFIQRWIDILEKEPNELFHAAEDAQQMAWYILDFAQEREIKQEMQIVRDEVEVQPDKLQKGEVIPHNNLNYEVLAVLKNNNYKMKVQETTETFRMKPSDVVFTSLMNARNNSQEQSHDHHLGADAEELAEREQAAYQLTR